MRNLALTSGVLSTLMSPPCASTTSLMIFVPNPVPRGVLLRMAGSHLREFPIGLGRGDNGDLARSVSPADRGHSVVYQAMQHAM